MTQQQLADRIGVAKSVVSYYESGDRYPSYDVLIRIAHVFHTSTDYLLDFEKESVIDVTGLSKEDIAVVCCGSAEAEERRMIKIDTHFDKIACRF